MNIFDERDLTCDICSYTGPMNYFYNLDCIHCLQSPNIFEKPIVCSICFH